MHTSDPIFYKLIQDEHLEENRKNINEHMYNVMWLHDSVRLMQLMLPIADRLQAEGKNNFNCFQVHIYTHINQMHKPLTSSLLSLSCSLNQLPQVPALGGKDEKSKPAQPK